MKLIDNINALWGDDLKATLTPKSRLKVAASCFSIYAWEALKKELAAVESLEFLFTAPTFIPAEVTDKLRKERREFHIPHAKPESGIYGSEFEIQLRNKLTQKAIAKECANWIRKKAIFKSNSTVSSMQQFACIDAHAITVSYQPLQGFTAVDLGYQQGNSVSNMVAKIDETPMARTFLALFENIWGDAAKVKDVTESICQHLESVYQENAPERIYFLILQSIFQDFLSDIDEDTLPNDRTGYLDTLVWKKLFNYQHDAAIGIINKLEKFNGCILADSVGLGKTFTALAVIKYYELRNRTVLVLCPKKLADNWSTYTANVKTDIFARDRFNYDVLFHTDLSRNGGESMGIRLDQINWGNYDLVVIDESHNFRNNDAVKDRETRYQRLMNRVIRDGVKTKVLMLSATPVNNRFADLRNQLALAYEGESESLQKKLNIQSSIETVFARAQAAFGQWSRLPPEERTQKAILDALDFDFFEVLDSVTIARSRKHIQTYYDTKDIGRFPTRLPPISCRSPLTRQTGVLDFNEIYERLAELTLAVYAPLTYILPSCLQKYAEKYDTETSGHGRLSQVDRERSLQALMTINLLKRLESSVHSFRLTLQGLRDNIARSLATIQTFKKSKQVATVGDATLALENLDAEDDELPDLDGLTVGGKVQISLADMDVPSWERELLGDQALVDAILKSMSLVTPSQDAKLRDLKQLIATKIEQPLNAGNRKIIIFTAFADTANYLYEHLSQDLLAQHGLHTARVSGKDKPKSTLGKSYDFMSLLTLFSPRSKEKAVALPQESGEIDILIGTDCISEGQNLQDCDYLINYDIHWNPVRIIQRFGRIDRVGSINQSIQLVNFWPDISLDEYIHLKERVENRMIVLDIAATGGDNILATQSDDVAYRKEQLRRLQEEVVELEDLKTGVSITDLGLNDFRMDILQQLRLEKPSEPDIAGLHAVVPAQPEIGLHPGCIFALRNINNTIATKLQNRLHPYYLAYVGTDGQLLVDYTDIKKLLDLVRCACKGKSEPIDTVCRLFNEQTKDGSRMEHYSGLLHQAIKGMVDHQQDKDVDSLFTAGRTTALAHGLAGLRDFELIAFIVVMGES